MDRILGRIYYRDLRVDVGTREDYLAAPDEGVQVMVELREDAPARWQCSRGPVRDRLLWTGDDEYDPWGWGVKRGELIPDAEYFAIYERACSD